MELNEIQTIKINIYPNPTSGNIMLTLDKENLSPDMKFVLTNLSGVRVRQIQINTVETTIETKGLAPGVYLYQIGNNDGKTAKGKIEIQ